MKLTNAGKRLFVIILISLVTITLAVAVIADKKIDENVKEKIKNVKVPKPDRNINENIVTYTAGDLVVNIETDILEKNNKKVKPDTKDGYQVSVKSVTPYKQKIKWYLNKGGNMKGIVNTITSNEKILVVGATEIKFEGTSYFYNFQDYVDNGMIVQTTLYDAYTFEVIAYKNDYKKEKAEFDPVFGSNVNTRYYQFIVCHPDWVCDTYGACEINDTEYCISATDNNACGLAFDGNWSKVMGYTDTCNYCTQTWDSSFTGCTNAQKQLLYTYANSCCNITGLPSDCAVPVDNGTITDCYDETYTTSDLPKITGDVIGTFLNEGVGHLNWVVPILLIVALGAYALYHFRKP